VRAKLAVSAAAVIGLSALALLGVGVTGIAHAVSQPDRQCTEPHTPTAARPAAPTSPADYLALGDHEYSRGQCDLAVAAYARAIELDPAFAEAYNNRAYTRMRQQQYALALPDLDRAVALRPNYVNALMNRGGIYNYYYAIDRGRALADYDRVIAQGPAARRGTAVCGHRAVALNDGFGFGVVLDMFAGGGESGCRD
jgi:tetratricopeptide (TPR) repeat protein